MYEDNFLESDYEDRSLIWDSYDNWPNMDDRDYAEEEYNRRTDHEEDETDEQPKPEVCPECLLPSHEYGCWPLSDEPIGIGTFEDDNSEADEYRRALESAQFGYMI